MENIREYIVIENNSAEDLTAQINERLKEGWTLFGAPFSRGNGQEASKICQAMVKNYETGNKKIGFSF
jgi:hypothetical protein